MKVAFLATDMVEQIELTVPWDAVKGEGWEPQLVSLRPGTIQGANHHDKGVPFPVDRTLDEVDAGDTTRSSCRAVLRILTRCVRTRMLCRSCVTSSSKASRSRRFAMARGCSSRPMSCAGRRLTSWPSLRTDIRNAGGEWEDEPVVVDKGLVTSRKPDDLGAFCSKLVEEFREGHHAGQAAATGAQQTG